LIWFLDFKDLDLPAVSVTSLNGLTLPTREFFDLSVAGWAGHENMIMNTNTPNTIARIVLVSRVILI
jgi:hypothetical protein